jgi:hypothetical protein
LNNKFIRITLMIFFFLFVYDVLFAIGIFFAIDSIVLSMYLCWIALIVLFGSLLQFKQYNFKVNKPKNPIGDIVGATLGVLPETGAAGTGTGAAAGTGPSGTGTGAAAAAGTGAAASLSGTGTGAAASVAAPGK